jgi:glycosyltransferase involved in cell wall biosynthesis
VTIAPPSGRPLNILQVCDHLGWEGSRMHGVKRLFGWMIPRFDARRYKVSLVSLRRKDLSEETLESLGIDITYLGRSKFDPATLPALLKIIKRRQIDVLHMHGYGATTFGRIAAGMRGTPAILHEHANLTDTPWFQKVADAVLERETDLALAVSQSTADFVVKARQIPPDKVKVVYLGVPLEEFSRPRSAEAVAAARAELGCAPGDFLIGSVTRLHESKGNTHLVDAARLVLDARPQARFVVIGEGPLQQGLEAQAARLGLGERFTFAGFAKVVARVVSAFDVSAFPSLWEGTPLTVFEALAMGKPIVATDADGLVDVLTPEHDALIVPRGDPQALAGAIIRMVDDAGARERLSAQAQLTARQYDIATFVAKMERLYDLLHRVSRATHRRGVLAADLSFLTSRAPA